MKEKTKRPYGDESNFRDKKTQWDMNDHVIGTFKQTDGA